MVTGVESVFQTDRSVASGVLRKFVSGISSSAIVTFNGDKSSVTLSTFAPTVETTTSRNTQAIEAMLREASASVARYRTYDLSHSELEALCTCSKHAGSGWAGFALEYANGRRDRIALQLDSQKDIELTCNYLKLIWPILREDCLREALEISSATSASGTDGVALQWQFLDNIDVGLIILDAASLMYRINAAGRHLVEQGQVLRRGRGGIFATNEADNHAFRSAVAACATAEEPGQGDTVLFVTRKDDGQRVPITLSRYLHDGAPTRFVVAMLPLPPDPKRVEMLVQKMGLSSSEAKVASLMQIGLTNREAAAMCGLKEQTFNTYAKRVLSKLNVSGRTEMAQLLTWQAAGGRIT